MRREKKQQRLISCACGCNELLLKYDRVGIERRFINHHNSKNENNYRWSGGNYSSGNGYNAKKSPKHPYANKRGYIQEHRLVVEEYYTRKWFIPFYLDNKTIDVHHKNNDKLDNRIENLMIIGKADHTRSHNLKKTYKRIDMSDRRCLVCNSKTSMNKLTETNNHNRRNPTYRWYKYKNGFICDVCYGKIIRRGSVRLA